MTFRIVSLSTAEILRRDDGCDVAEHCEDCPLEVCRFEGHDNFRERIRQARRLAIWRMSERGKMTVGQLARYFHMTPRTIWRAKRQAQLERTEMSNEELVSLLRLTMPELFELRDQVQDLERQLPMELWP